MATQFQVKRSTVSGVRPTTSNIQQGELAINLADGIAFSTNGTSVFELGSNNTYMAVGNSTVRFTVNTTALYVGNSQALVANGSNGSSGQVLTSNGTGIYWSTPVASVNVAAQYAWTNTHSFSAAVTYTGGITVGNSTVNTQLSNGSIVTSGANSLTVGTAFTVAANGNVGISTASPGYNLHVIGNAYVSSNLTVNNAVVSGLLDIEQYMEVKAAPTISAGSLTLDLATATTFDVALNGNITTLTISNTPSTANRTSGFVLVFTADGTPRTVAWPGSVKWANGTAPTVTSTNAKKDVYAFFTTDNGTSYNGFIAGQNI